MLALLVSALTRQLPYYDAQWKPVVIIAVLALGYIRPGAGAALAALLSLPALLYHAPTWAVSVLLFSLLFLATATVLGESRAVAKRIAVYAFPFLAVTPLAPLLPFVGGGLFGKRGAWVVFWGILLAMISGIVLGQPVMGGYFSSGASAAQRWVLPMDPPANWQSFGWMAQLDLYRQGAAGVLEVGRALGRAFTVTPFPLMQLGLWCLVAWLVGWATEEPGWQVGAGAIVLAALVMIAAYQVIFTALFGWVLPFEADRALNRWSVIGAGLALVVRYGGPWLLAKLEEHQVPERVAAEVRAAAQRARRWAKDTLGV